MRLGLVSDLHVTMDPDRRASWHNPYDFAGVPGRIEAARAVFQRAGVDAVIACGDFTHDGDEQSTRLALGRLSADLGRPLLVVAGNHDLRERDDQLERCLPDGGRMLAANGWANANGVRLTGVPVERDATTRASRWTGEGVLVADGRPHVVASHFPVLSRAARMRELGLAYPRELDNRAELCDHVAGAGPAIVLSGHIHARESHANGNVLQLSAGALVESPYEVAVVDVRVSRGRVRVRRRAHSFGPPPAGPNPAIASADERWTFATGSWKAGRACRRR
jgi:predicted phosphodiesterase